MTLTGRRWEVAGIHGPVNSERGDQRRDVTSCAVCGGLWPLTGAAPGRGAS